MVGFSGAACCVGTLLTDEETELWEDDEDEGAEDEEDGGVVTGATIASWVWQSAEHPSFSTEFPSSQRSP